MFEIGVKIVYGSEGVFTVKEYTSSPISKDDDRVYYVLEPSVGPSGNIIIAPSEGGSTAIRGVLDCSAAEALLENIADIPPVTVEKEKNRREIYRNVMSLGKCEGFVSIIKTVKKRREEFFLQKRRISETDADFESRAKHCLYSELSVALEMPYAEIEGLINEKLK